MQGLSADEATAVWKPFLEWVKANPSDIDVIDWKSLAATGS